MWKVRELADKVTNVVMNYTEIESKVREATSDENWGPTGTQKNELSQATFSYDQFPEVMGMLWKRISENKRFPRRIYKSLLLLHFLILNGSDRVIRACQDRLYELRSLLDYHIEHDPTPFNINSMISGTDEKSNKETTLNIRVKAKEIVDLLQDDERLKEERKKSRKNRDKYVGYSSDRMTFSSTAKWDNNDDSNYYDRDIRDQKDDDSDFNKFSSNRNNNSSSYNKKSSPEPKNFDDSPGSIRSNKSNEKVLNNKSSTDDFGDFTHFSSSTSNNNNNINTTTSSSSNSKSITKTKINVSITPTPSSTKTAAAAATSKASTEGNNEFADFSKAFPSGDSDSPVEPEGDLLGGFDDFATIRANSSSPSFDPILNAISSSSNNQPVLDNNMMNMNSLPGVPGHLQFQQQMPNNMYRPVVPMQQQYFQPPSVANSPMHQAQPQQMMFIPQTQQPSLLQPQSLQSVPTLTPIQSSVTTTTTAATTPTEQQSNNKPSLLELKRQQLSGINPNNTNQSENNNQEDNPLKGTTWSDLNISLTSLSLNKKK